MRCAIWQHLYNLKNVKNTHGGLLILVKVAGFSRTLRISHGRLNVSITLFNLSSINLTKWSNKFKLFVGFCRVLFVWMYLINLWGWRLKGYVSVFNEVLHRVFWTFDCLWKFSLPPHSTERNNSLPSSFSLALPF